MSPASARIRAAWPLLLLVAGLACIVLALREAERSVRSNQELADQALRGYGSFAAWSFEEHFSEAIRVATQEVLGGVNMFHESPPIPAAGGPGTRCPWNVACDCHRARFGPLPVAFLGFKLGSDTLGVAYNQAPARLRRLAGGYADAGTGNGAAATVARTQHRAARAGPSRPDESGARPCAAVGLSLSRSRTTAIRRWRSRLRACPRAGATPSSTRCNTPARSIDSMLAATFDERDLVPGAIAVKGSNREILDAEVRDASGHVLFTSEPHPEWLSTRRRPSPRAMAA